MKVITILLFGLGFILTTLSCTPSVSYFYTADFNDAYIGYKVAKKKLIVTQPIQIDYGNIRSKFFELYSTLADLDLFRTDARKIIAAIFEKVSNCDVTSEPYYFSSMTPEIIKKHQLEDHADLLFVPVVISMYGEGFEVHLSGQLWDVKEHKLIWEGRAVDFISYEEATEVVGSDGEIENTREIWLDQLLRAASLMASQISELLYPTDK